MENRVFAPTTKMFAELGGYPSKERLYKGMVAIIECEQEIPCNPCESSCRQHAILVGDPITNLPILKGELCVGCGLCVANCPGQAIFMIDMTYKEKTALVGLPYEFIPLPEVGQVVTAADRNGEALGAGTVRKIVSDASLDKTNVVYVEVSKEIAEETRMIRLE